METSLKVQAKLRELGLSYTVNLKRNRKAYEIQSLQRNICIKANERTMVFSLTKAGISESKGKHY